MSTVGANVNLSAIIDSVIIIVLTTVFEGAKFYPAIRASLADVIKLTNSEATLESRIYSLAKLVVDFSQKGAVGHPGATKEAFLGRIEADGQDLVGLLKTKSPVCVKQLRAYRDHKNLLKRRDVNYTIKELSGELFCLEWASSLMDYVNDWVAGKVESRGEEPPFPIPQMEFVQGALVLARHGASEKAFLVETLIKEESDGPFIKYIHNSLPAPSDHVQELGGEFLKRAEFLCFAQHLQYWKTGQLFFVSDFQGLDIMLLHIPRL